ncbi:amidase family protein [Tissierellaceae bacterium HCP3S3_D8]
MELLNKNVSQLLQMMKDGEISSEKLVERYIEEIEKENSNLKIYREIMRKEAVDRAREIDRRRKDGEKLGLFAGIPIAVTDDISTKGIPTRAGSKMLENYIPPFDATVVEWLLKEDAIIIGKIDVSEFGNTSMRAGTAISKNQAAFALSSDAGGSARYSALQNGVFFMKPTYGMVSRYGAVGNTTTFDQIGPVTKNIMDMALALNAIVGWDRRDSTSISRDKVDYTSVLTGDVKGLKIGLPMEYIEKNMDSKEISQIIADLEELGASIEKISIPSLDYVLPAYSILSSAEVASNAAKYDGLRYGYRTDEYEDVEDLYRKTRSEGFGMEVKKQILFGNFVVSDKQYEGYYKKAQRVRTLIKNEFNNIFKSCDLILCPEPLSEDGFRFKEYTLAANMTGLPAIVVPYEKSSVGLHFIGSIYGEDTLLKMAYACEAVDKVGGEV